VVYAIGGAYDYPNLTIAAEQRVVFAQTESGVYGAGGQLQYVDGVLVASEEGPYEDPLDCAINGNTVRIGGGTSGTQYEAECVIHYLMHWQRDLSASEILDLYVDPFQFLEHPTDKVFVFFGGGGSPPAGNVPQKMASFFRLRST